MQKLFDALEKEGWSERQIQKLARDNVLRVLREVW
jgi:microsomal dipeptidase-like Zn-dependent dipeptidase